MYTYIHIYVYENLSKGRKLLTNTYHLNLYQWQINHTHTHTHNPPHNIPITSNKIWEATQADKWSWHLVFCFSKMIGSTPTDSICLDSQDSTSHKVGGHWHVYWMWWCWFIDVFSRWNEKEFVVLLSHLMRHLHHVSTFCTQKVVAWLPVVWQSLLICLTF